MIFVSLLRAELASSAVIVHRSLSHSLSHTLTPTPRIIVNYFLKDGSFMIGHGGVGNRKLPGYPLLSFKEIGEEPGLRWMTALPPTGPSSSIIWPWLWPKLERWWPRLFMETGNHSRKLERQIESNSTNQRRRSRREKTNTEITWRVSVPVQLNCFRSPLGRNTLKNKY